MLLEKVYNPASNGKGGTMKKYVTLNSRAVQEALGSAGFEPLLDISLKYPILFINGIEGSGRLGFDDNIVYTSDKIKEGYIAIDPADIIADPYALDGATKPGREWGDIRIRKVPPTAEPAPEYKWLRTITLRNLEERGACKPELNTYALWLLQKHGAVSESAPLDQAELLDYLKENAPCAIPWLIEKGFLERVESKGWKEAPRVSQNLLNKNDVVRYKRWDVFEFMPDGTARRFTDITDPDLQTDSEGRVIVT